MTTLLPIWDDPGIQEVAPGEIECCARCLHLAQYLDDFDRFARLRYVHWLWRELHRTWREGDPVE